MGAKFEIFDTVVMGVPVGPGTGVRSRDVERLEEDLEEDGDVELDLNQITVWVETHSQRTRGIS